MNNYNELPIDIARKKNYSEIVNILINKKYNPLCTLEMPIEYIKPNDIYKKIIIFMIVIPEIIIFILVLPFLESIVYYLLNGVSFLLCLLTYLILLGKEPGYQKNNQLLNECGGEEDNRPLKKLLENGSDLKAYCPTCYVLRGEDRKHCFICDKCVSNMSHHCFWINKCIGKKNKIIYIIFVFSAFLDAFCSLFICINLILDTVNIPYKKDFLWDWLYSGIDRGFRVLGAAVVGIFSGFSTFPLFFLFMIEMFKLCGLLGTEKNKEYINDDTYRIKNDEGRNLELQSKEPLLYDDNNINSINDERETKIKIPKDNFPIVDDRPSTTD